VQPKHYFVRPARLCGPAGRRVGEVLLKKISPAEIFLPDSSFSQVWFFKLLTIGEARWR
jgi:hypothetical protein